MPALNTEAVDDVVALAASVDFRGGMNSTVLPHLLADNSYASAKNMRLTKTGRLQTRPGSNSIDTNVSGSPIRKLIWFDRVGSEYLLAVADSDLHKWDGSAWVPLSGFSLTGPFSAFQLQDRTVIINGSSLVVVNSAGGVTTPSLSGSGSPAGHIATVHSNGVVRAGDPSNPESVYFSHILEETAWAANDVLTVGAEGETITALHSWDVFNLLVFKGHSTYLVVTSSAAASSGTPPSTANFQIQPVSRTVGCAAKDTVVQIGADVWWLSDQGVVSIRRLQQETQREISSAISLPIQSYIDRINWSVADKASAVFFDNQYVLAVPLDTATEPDHLLIYDTYHQTWSAYWTGLTPTSLAVSYFSDLPALHLGDSTGRLRVFVPTNEADYDNGVTTPIESEVRCKAFNFGDPVVRKRLASIEVEFQDSEASADVLLQLDGSDVETSIFAGISTGRELLSFPWDFATTGSVRFVEPGHLRRGRSLLHIGRYRETQPIIRSDENVLSLRSVVLGGFMEPMRLTT